MLPNLFSSQRAPLTAAAFLMLMCGAGVLASNGDQVCKQIPKLTATSPDGRWIASTYEEVCDLGLVTSDAAVIALGQSEHSRSQVIIGMDAPSSDSDWPKAYWQAANRILIIVSNHSELSLQMARYQGVDVEVRYCPDDPVERRRWLQYKEARAKWVSDTAKWFDQKKVNPQLTTPKPVEPSRMPEPAPSAAVHCKP